MKRHLLQEERYTSIRTIMEPTSLMKWDIHQMDVNTTFLNGVIEEEVYIEQPQRFEVEERHVWIRKLMSVLFNLVMDTTKILCDNQSCIKMLENPVFHDRSKHIEIWYFYIRDKIQMMMF